jgi:hypothetical protein
MSERSPSEENAVFTFVSDPFHRGRKKVELTATPLGWNWAVMYGSPARGIITPAQCPVGTSTEEVAKLAWGLSGARYSPAWNYVQDLARTFRGMILMSDDGERLGVSEKDPGVHRALETILKGNGMQRSVFHCPPEFEPRTEP